jgi:hypothetical protein
VKREFFNIDLFNSTPDQRALFFYKLFAYKWIQVKGKDNDWTAEFREDLPDSKIVEIAKKDIENATLNSGIRKYFAKINVGLLTVDEAKV